MQKKKSVAGFREELNVLINLDFGKGRGIEGKEAMLERLNNTRLETGIEVIASLEKRIISMSYYLVFNSDYFIYAYTEFWAFSLL